VVYNKSVVHFMFTVFDAVARAIFELDTLHVIGF
jgi:hypothetical protein